MNGPCPTCGGRGGVSEAWGLPTSGLVPCPDCAGTGKAQSSITANENETEAWRRHWMEAVSFERKAVRRGNRLAEALNELVELLEPLEAEGRMNIPGLATLNKYRAALREAGV